MKLTPYQAAFAALGILWLVAIVLTKSWKPWHVIIGADRRPSTSKLQFFLWTLVVIFAYVAVTTARINAGHFEAALDFPANLLIVMGFSAATLTAAKGITVSNIESGSLSKPPAVSSSLSSVLKDDGGLLDLSKIQLVAWTIIAVVFYLIRLNDQLRSNSSGILASLPDVDAPLMVLMGLSQGAYLGKKLVTTSTPRLSALNPASSKATEEITLMGTAFGETQAGSVITIDNRPENVLVTTWSDSEIKFKLAPMRSDGTPWAAGQTLLIGLISGGQESANKLPFVIAP